jgi:hypothetical protein
VGVHEDDQGVPVAGSAAVGRKRTGGIGGKDEGGGNGNCMMFLLSPPPKSTQGRLAGCGNSFPQPWRARP